MNNHDRIWILISRKLTSEASETDLQELQDAIVKNPEIRLFMDFLTDMWKPDVKSDRLEAGRAFSRHMKRMHEKFQRVHTVHSRLGQFNFGIVKNYFKVIYRNLYRFKSFSVINISGLAIGMASAILILLLVQNELSFDRFHEKKDRIYMLLSRGMINGHTEVMGTPGVLGQVLKSEYPQVEEVTRLNGTGPIVLSANERQLEGKGMMVDSVFLKIFSYPLLRGNAENALNSPRSVILTESFAKKFFGNEDAMGKTIRVDSNNNFTVTGILKDLPDNTTFQPLDYLLPWSYMKETGWEKTGWENNDNSTVVLLKPGISEKIANERFRDVIRTHAQGLKWEVFVHPLTKWRLWSRFENGKIVGGGIESVRLYLLLAGFILLIACINYMNLSTARSVKRGKEVGIRKVVGGGRFSIAMRFLGESVFISLLSVALCLVFVQLGIRGFNWLTVNNLIVPYGNPNFWLGILGFALFTGLIAGSYPAFYLSSFRPISVLKGTFKTTLSLISVRKILVVLQFSFAITFIICTIVIYRQINFGAKRDPEYNRDHLAFI